VALTRIGRCTDGGGVQLQCGSEISPVQQGYSHFARLKGSRSEE